jgi:type IV pilus assembly protein PilN
VKLDLERQTRAATALQKEIRALKEKKETAQNRLNLLQSLEKERHGPVRLMENLSSALPVNQLWLTALKENGPEIRIEGIALNNDFLAEYMKRLESRQLFTRVDLVQSSQIVLKEMKVKQFSLVAWTSNMPLPEGKK